MIFASWQMQLCSPMAMFTASQLRSWLVCMRLAGPYEKPGAGCVRLQNSKRHTVMIAGAMSELVFDVASGTLCGVVTASATVESIPPRVYDAPRKVCK